MSLRLPVYIASVNNLSDARYCAGMGVRWLGFSSSDLNSILSENDLQGILAWVEGIETILEIRSHKIEIEHMEMDFDAYLSAEDNLLPKNSKTQILEIAIEDIGDIKDLIDKKIDSDYVLLISKTEIKSIKEGLKNQLKKMAEIKPIILGLGINEENLPWIEKELKPAGIMLKGGNEIRPGLKDFDGLAEILEYLEED